MILKKDTSIHKKSKRKVIVALVVFVAMAICSSYALVSVLAAVTQNLNSDLAVTYLYAKNVSGVVEGTYTFAGVEHSMTTDEGYESVAINAGDITSTAGNLNIANGEFDFTEQNDNIVLKYKFINVGTDAFTATMDIETLISTNIGIMYSLDGSTYSSTKQTLTVESAQTRYYYVKLSINDKTLDATFDGKINWFLQANTTRAEGLYDSNGTLTSTWDELVSDGTIEVEGTEITRVDNSISGEVIIPEGVTSIGDHSFSECDNITSVVIPEGVTTISGGSFFNCLNLTNIVIPEGVTTIGAEAFWGCENLTDIDIPNTVTAIGECAFDGCNSLTSVVIPDSVTSIGNYVFGYCEDLKDVEIGDSLISVGDYIFNGCSSLTSIIVDENNQYFASEGNCLLSKDKTESIAGCQTSVIPNSVERICVGAFANIQTITSIVIPNSVKEINSDVFMDCYNLKEVVLSENLERIGNDAFSNCISLTEIVIPDSVVEIAGSTFSGCINLISVTIGNGLDEISPMAFGGCESLTKIVIPENIRLIGMGAFAGCVSLTEIIIPENVRVIGMGAFAICENLTSVEFENKEGWIVDGEEIHSNDLEDFELAAEYLTITYMEQEWYK